MTACREYQGARSRQGYGRMWRGGKELRVHRWVVAQVLGWDAIEGLMVRHTCDNPPCFLYEHLLVGTHQENMDDMVARGRARSDKCQFGHPIEERNGIRRCRTCQYAAIARYRAWLKLQKGPLWLGERETN